MAGTFGSMFVGLAASRPTGCRGLRKNWSTFAMTTPSVKAVLRASRTVPIVFTKVTDPVAHGLIERLNQPGRSLTGITLFEREIGSKLEMVIE
jgi:putative tryptophan/tyrosine transport system substrate-binding protein